MYFNVTIKVDRQQDNGQVKTIKETYAFDSLTYTEAEARATSELASRVSGDLIIDSIKKTRISEVINADFDKFYLAKVAFVVVDEKTMTEKRSITPILIGAATFKDALEALLNVASEWVTDYDIVSIAESPILEIFEHN